MVDKYIGLDANGNEKETPFNQNSAGAADAGKGVALNADGKIDESMLYADTTNAIAATENMVAPALVNVFNSSGPKVRYADASAANLSKVAMGYIKDSVTAPAAVNVYFGRGDIIPGFSGLTPGATYFLSNTTPGGIQTAPVTTSGHALQPVGYAISTTELKFDPETPIIRG